MSPNNIPVYGQIALNNQDSIKQPEKACIEAPVVLDQLQMRECVTRNIALLPSPDNDHPIFKFVGADNFKITDIRVFNKFPVALNEKKVDLLIFICYDLHYSDGENDLIQPDNACFELSVDKVKCPVSNIKQFSKKCNDCSKICGKEKSYFSAEALAQAFGEIICSNTGALIIDLGVFFIIKSICIAHFCVPSAIGCVQNKEQKETNILKTDEKRNSF